MKIFKYPLKLLGVATFTIPSEAEPMSVIRQGEDIVLYVRMDTPNAPHLCERHFALFPTGDLTHVEEISAGYRINRGTRAFIGTACLGSFVLHCFEVFPL